MAAVTAVVEGLPWQGGRRNAVTASATAIAGVGRQQASAERELAQALRRLAVDAEAELRFLAELADRARSHLEDLLRRARALVDLAASAVAEAAARVGGMLLDVLAGDPVGALREAREVAEQASDRMRSIAVRLSALPVPYDPQWRRIGPEILGWRPL